MTWDYEFGVEERITLPSLAKVMFGSRVVFATKLSLTP